MKSFPLYGFGLHPTRVKKFLLAKTKEEALFMGCFDRNIDYARMLTCQATKLEILTILYDNVYGADAVYPNNISLKSKIIAFNKIANESCEYNAFKINITPFTVNITPFTVNITPFTVNINLQNSYNKFYQFKVSFVIGNNVVITEYLNNPLEPAPFPVPDSLIQSNKKTFESYVNYLNTSTQKTVAPKHHSLVLNSTISLDLPTYFETFARSD